MYESFYGLTERPFSLTPDPRYVYYSAHYRETKDMLGYGIDQREGFMVLTGIPGSGKTTLCRELLNQLDTKQHQTALLFNPFLGGQEMLQALLSEFGVTYPRGANRKELLEKLNAFLLAQVEAGRICVAIFDEAQHLTAEFLEQIRVLSNLETEREKLLHIILVGQPELLDRIRSDDLAQLDQRVSVRCTLGPLPLEETDRYIHHRLNVAGAQGRIQIAPRALRAIHTASGGVPRLINLICDRALLAGFTDQTFLIGPKQVDKALRLVKGEEEAVATTLARRLRRKTLVLGMIGVLLVLGLLGALTAPLWR